MSKQKQQLRTEIKRKRAGLSRHRIANDSQVIAARLWDIGAMWRAESIGVYISAFGEVDCAHFVRQAWLRKKRIFAPILRKNRLLFAPLTAASEAENNRYGIPEPVHSARDLVAPRQLDAVLVPLVAFDTQLNRLGMGAGYYDRSFMFRLRRRRWRKPLLIGVAYSFQCFDSVPANSWDVPLDVVITEKESYGSY